MTMDAVLQVQGLRKTLGGKPVLRGVDLAVCRGEILVIIGRSGCGKSVLLRHLIGLLRSDEGSVQVDGVDLSRMPEAKLDHLRLQFGMVFQDAALFDSMSVFENVAFALREHTRMPFPEIQARVKDCLATVDLQGVEDQYPETLSGGMRKRVGLARALAMNPKIILYDEPTAGLDRLTARGINELIVRLNRQLRVTSVVVTHDVESAKAIASRIALLEGGTVTALGTPAQLLASEDEVVQAFLKQGGFEI